MSISTADPHSQDEVIRLLSDASTYGAGPVERIETHVSEVFLVGDRALKLKRAVVFPYLDFSTAGKRRAACEAEVRINRRTAPDIYKGVVAVTRRRDGTLAVGGDGTPVDWLVDMRRFDQDTLFDRLARKGALKRAMMEDLADAIARFHDSADVRTDAGGRAGVAMILNSNAQCFVDWGPGILDAAETDSLGRQADAALAAAAPVLERRRRGGRVRFCHGDLHLRNICLVDGRPTLFDGIEFNDAFATIDVLYDLAFLLMDLDTVGWRLASIVFNRYLDVTGDATADRGLGSWRCSCRCGRRSAPTSTRRRRVAGGPRQGGGARRGSARIPGARRRLPETVPPRLVAVGGFPAAASRGWRGAGAAPRRGAGGAGGAHRRSASGWPARRSMSASARPDTRRR